MPNRPASAQSKRWVFTINNPSEADDPYQWENRADPPDVLFCEWQYEVGSNGTRHIQGHLVVDRRVRLGGIRALNGRAHWEVRRGTLEQARAYCTKVAGDPSQDGSEVFGREFGPWPEGQNLRLVGGPHSFGDAPGEGQGRRNDLLSLKRVLDAGGSLLDCFEEDFASTVKLNRGLMLYKRLRTGSTRNWLTTCVVYFGESGTGKSRRALAEGGPSSYWLPRPEGDRPWWDGYDGQEVIVIDDFYGWIKRDFLYRLIDRFPLSSRSKVEPSR